jgi:hypothetical protein
MDNDGHGMTVKGNDDNGWSSDGMMLWLERRQNRDAIECFGFGLRGNAT